MATSSFRDSEFGDVVVRRSHLSRNIRLKIEPGGQLSVILPPRCPIFLAKGLLSQSRSKIRRHLGEQEARRSKIMHGDIIGKTHKLVVNAGDDFGSRLTGTDLNVFLPPGLAAEDRAAQDYIRTAALKALRIQAKSYLPRRLAVIANDNGLQFESVRFTNASTRWGSCSSRRTISLNIWLMQLPFDLIDYVLVHELCHTKHLNHSAQFWAAVEAIMPDYKVRRKILKTHQPC